jgi:antitoxin component of MazEF toxin-antitoxin module
VALNLLCDLLQHVYFLQVGVSVHNARQDVVQPASALTARRALATALNLAAEVAAASSSLRRQ